jgi:hypothetical protein
MRGGEEGRSGNEGRVREGWEKRQFGYYKLQQCPPSWHHTPSNWSKVQTTTLLH